MFASLPSAGAEQDVSGGLFGPTIPGPTNYAGHVDRAIEYAQYHNWKAAAYELTQAINKAPATIGSRPAAIGDLYGRRAQALLLAGYATAALNDCDAAQKLDPRNRYVGRTRYSCLTRLHRFGDALRALEIDMKTNPSNTAECLNNMAWVRATCPDAKFRDGKLAVIQATRACELDRWKHATMIDTLAAASAEVGDFERAVNDQRRVLALAGRFERQRAAEARLALYLQRQRYRDPFDQ